jgi:hypothetical protein
MGFEERGKLAWGGTPAGDASNADERTLVQLKIGTAGADLICVGRLSERRCGGDAQSVPGD